MQKYKINILEELGVPTAEEYKAGERFRERLESKPVAERVEILRRMSATAKALIVYGYIDDREDKEKLIDILNGISVIADRLADNYQRKMS